METGTPAVYIEDEIILLLDAGVMISPAKDKYRTNFHILRQNAVAQFKEQFAKLFEGYLPLVLDVYEKYLPKLKKCNVFKFDASENQWAWFFAKNIADFDYEGHSLSVEDYPQILSCGSKAFYLPKNPKDRLGLPQPLQTLHHLCHDLLLVTVLPTSTGLFCKRPTMTRLVLLAWFKK